MPGKPGLATSRSEGLLHKGLPQQRPDAGLKRSSDVEVISCSLPNKDAVMTFSHTLPRVHTPQAMAAYEEAARRHAATLHHASMDSSRSKQLLSQWKSKNNHKCSFQMPDSFSSSVDSSSGQSSQHPHLHSSMELQPPALSLNGGFDSYLSKLAAGGSNTLPSNCSGITGGARMSMQSRPGSSQLVHIPEEALENYNATKMGLDRGCEGAPTSGCTAQANWQRASEKMAGYRPSDGGTNAQPRVMQLIALSKQQGLLQTHSKSLDDSTIGCSTTGSHQGAAHCKALTDQIPAPSSLGSASGSVSGSTGTIVRVEAHPEIRPAAPPTDGAASWRWRSIDHDSGAGAGTWMSGTGAGENFRQSFELNDLNRDSESGNSLREGSIDRKRASHIVSTAATMTTPPVATVHTQNASQSEQRLPTQGFSTIRVTPGDSGCLAPAGGGGGGRGGGGMVSETPSVASSRESTLHRKGSNVLVPERASSPDNAQNVFYK